MADEWNQEPRPPATRRPTEPDVPFKPHLTRKPSDLLPPPVHGQFTPELSPLDAFVSRGRQLYRQLEQEERELRKREESKSPDASQPSRGQGQFLQQPPRFIRSHSAGAEQELGVGTLNAAVEQWAIGNSKSHKGGDRATKLFAGRGASPLSNGAKIPQVSVGGPPIPGPRTPGATPAAPQTLSIKEPGFRPVSQHPRISGFGFEDEMGNTPRVSQYVTLDNRNSSVNRSAASSPRSPRMPFTSDDDSSDEEEERRRRRESARRRDLERRRPVSTSGRGQEPSPVREGSEPKISIEEARSSPSGLPPAGLPQRSFSGLTPSPKPMDAAEQARKGSLDSNATSRTITPSLQTKIPTPPHSASPVSRFPESPNHNRQTSGLAAPVLPTASTSTPNLLLRSHQSNGSTSSFSYPRTPVEPTITSLVNDDTLFLPPQPAFAKSAPNTPRPSSAMSDTASIYSVGGTKTAFNFSRPMSKASFRNAEGEAFRSPSMDMQRPTPRRTDSLDYKSFVDEAERRDAEEENFGETSEMRGPNSYAPRHRATGSGLSGRVGPTESYTYAAYNLPRGRQVDRQSIVFFDGERHRFNIDDDQPPVKRTNSSESDNPLSPTAQVPISPFAAMRASQESQRPSMNLNRPPEQQQQQPPLTPSLGRTPSSESNSSTLRPRNSAVPKLSPEEHLNIGIPLHEKGSYAESTYHFRLSAMGGNTTGMLMYALALRHGWGMRANQAEAFNWLRKAATLAQEEMANAEKDPTKPKPTWWESKGMRSKFALMTYELGMSYNNGWGCAEDKAQGLRYFEIAASWGDVDALSEAGYAYANGQGCKKDLKRSAKYYRMAAENGVSMVGNSWIWKDKYDDDDDRSKKSGKSGKEKEKEKDSKDKAGLLSFSRKKSNA
ncbi:hypothetical protein ABW19_dt0205916 [Dactylella cylindrospora]|nr:hypothetical protein ABW19_dt0205916 [Dactylella cylindrospora]